MALLLPHSFNMSPRFVRTQFQRAATLALVVVLAACGNSDIGAAKLKALKTGDKKPAILQVIGQGPLTASTAVDSMRVVSGFRIQKFVAKGMTHEILWYREAPGSLEDPITVATSTPLVVTNDTLAGWGWSFYSKYAEKNGLPDPSHDKARMDSIAQSQVELGKSLKKP